MKNRLFAIASGRKVVLNNVLVKVVPKDIIFN